MYFSTKILLKRLFWIINLKAIFYTKNSIDFKQKLLFFESDTLPFKNNNKK